MVFAVLATRAHRGPTSHSTASTRDKKCGEPR